ncbi:protein Shroom3 isoform X1 [Sarcophilus harrisii]|uniref:protein Shroom3 isoform X1 n=1 Tax=Sarcophilus harrisii TaxID=9305 RepID=UPI0013020206|nr:protein Shroom3 isoform X1 [Sarcophilus harrisii]
MALGREDCLALVLSRLGSQIRRKRRNVNADADQKPEVSPPFSPRSFSCDFQHRIATDGEIQPILRNWCSKLVSRPHSWHSAKSGEDQTDASMMQISQGTIGTPWHQNYHSSSSANDVSNYNHAFPRRSPDQYSSQGSMESLEHNGNYPPCHPLSPAKSTSSIDQLAHLHNKRDSAYSSFSTCSSILEYPPTSFSAQECSDTVATIPAQGNLLEGMRQADIRYVKTIYDTKRGISAEYEVNSSALLLPSGESQESVDDRWHNHPKGGRMPLLPWNQQYCTAHEVESNNVNHKVGAPMPPTRSGSYAVFRHYERPGSWSNLEHNRYGRPQSSFPGSLKTSFPEEHLHTLLEKSPENSPPVKPKQNYIQAPQPGQPLLPTSIYPVPSPEPHFAQMPQPSGSSNGMLYPALVKEHGYPASLSTCDKMVTLENGNQNDPSKSAAIFYQAPEDISAPLVEKPETRDKFSPYKPHFTSEPEKLRGTSLRKDEPRILEGNNMLPNGRESMHDSTHHIPQSLQIQAQEVNEGKPLPRPSEPRIAEFQETQNVRLQPRPEREGLTEDSWSTSGKTSSNILSLQTISESTRRQDNLETGQMGPQEGNPDSRPACLIKMNKMEQEPKKTVLDRWDHSDWQASHVRPEGGTKGSPPFHNSEPRYEVHGQASNLTQRRRSSSNALQNSHLGKLHCSVLEKVNKIEQREQGTRRPASVSSYSHRANKLEQTPSNRGSVISLEDPQGEMGFLEPGPSTGCVEENMIKEGKKKSEGVSWHPAEHQLKRGGNGSYGPTHPETKPLRSTPLLQRSQSTFQLSNKMEEETPWREERTNSPESPLLEVPLNQAYRNSIKHAQSRVLGATSFQRRDLDLGPPIPSQSRRGARQRPASAHLGLKSPEITPIPASPHIPKERHSINPVEGSPPKEDPIAMVTRVGGRRRLTAEQKKRSYSEPEKMNEVGVSGTEEPSPCYSQRRDLPFGFPENTVADRRRIFEREGKACSTLNLSRPELKQLQQTALADYIQRKTGKRPSPSASHRRESRSLTAASSMNSLQEQNPFPRRGSATLPTELVRNLDRNSLEMRGVRDRSSSFANNHLRAERHWHPKRESPRVDWLGEASGQPSLPQKVNWTHEKQAALVTKTRGPGKSMSAEDLLDRSDVLTVPFHSRSRSSPISDKKCQDLLLRGNIDHNLLGKTPSCTAGPGSRQFNYSERSYEEKSSLTHHPGPHKVPNGSSVLMECSKTLEPQRPINRSPAFGPSPGGRQGPFIDAKSSQINPFKSAQTNSTYPSQPYLYADRDAPAGRQSSPMDTPAAVFRNNGHILTQSHNPRDLEDNCLESLAENGMKKNKGPLPQKPPPSRVKWAHSLRDDNSVEPSSSSGVPSQKHYEQRQSLPNPNTTSNPNSPLGLFTGPGKISLRISESAFQAIPSLQDEGDDDVFVQDLRPSSTFKTLSMLPPPPPSPPPPPPPSPPSPPSEDRKTLRNSLEEFPPPPSPIIYEASGAPTNETYEDTCTSNSTRLSKLTIADSQRSSPTPASKSNIFIKALGAKQTTSLPTPDGQHQSTGTHVEHSSPEQMLSTQAQSLNQKPGNPTQEVEKSNPSPEKTPEDIRRESLVKQIVHQDKSLAGILDPDSRMKTTMDLMEGLFPQGPGSLKESNTQRKAIQRSTSFPVSEGSRSTEKERVGMLINCPAYYNVSAPKAELLNKLKSMPAEGNEDDDQLDVNEKKAKLIGSLKLKLESLKEAKESLLMDIKLNNALGEEVEVLIRKLCKPNEFDKYKMFIGDLDKVVNLLLSLSGRLARVENVLSGLGEDANNEERSSLNEKKKMLAGQHEDARELKENLDRRERVVLDILSNYLTKEQLQDYQHFVKMKSTLLIEQRKLDDKIKLGQEQLNCLLESLPRDFFSRARAPATVPPPEARVTSTGSCALRNVLPTLTSSL